MSARVNSDMGFYHKALSDLEQAYKVFKDYPDKDKLFSIVNNIGNVYWFQDDYSTALQFYRESAQIANTHLLYHRIALANMNIGLAYDEMGLIDSALYYYNSALKGVIKDNNEYGIGLVALNIGSLYLKNELIDSSRKYYNIALKKEKHFQPGLKAKTYIELGKMLHAAKQDAEAIKYLEKGKAIAQNSNHIISLKEYYFTLYQINTDKGNIKAALDNFLNYSELKDSIHNEDYKRKQAYFQNYFELDKKQSQLASLQKDTLLSHQKIRSQRLIIFISILSLILALALSIIFFIYLREHREYNRELKNRHKQLTRKNTMLLKREKELNESNESKNKLFSIIAHDIKNPLYAMLRLADVLEDKYDQHDHDKRKEYLRHLNQAGKEMVNLTENLLSWSRYQLGNIQFNPNYFPLVEAVNFAMGIFRHMADLKEINLDVKVHPSHMVYADFSMIMIVIRNITNNAIKFTNRKGTIEISSVQELDNIKMTIKDNGVGMDSSTIDKLFIVEKGVSRLGTEGEKGSGLGLTICKEFVERNQGEIGVNSVLGKGSSFWFSIPLHKMKS
jgi:two-component system sensor histidine kinase/response regulator